MAATHRRISGGCEFLGEMMAWNANRPYCVIDDGWQTKKKAELGQWSATRPSFSPPNLTSIARTGCGMKKRGVRPGIWMRPLIDEIKAWPEEWHLKRDAKILDPTLPDVRRS